MTAVRPRRQTPRNLTSRRIGRWPIIVGAVLAVLVACYAVPAVVLAGEIPPGTTVAGVDIGGYSPQSAERVLARELNEEATRPLILRAGKKTLRLSPRQAGLSIDTAATVADAEGSLSPTGVARALFGSNEVRLRVKVDRERLDAAIAKL